MRILHYFLGFPPYRTGGLTKFAYDLMCAQVKAGNDVMALWPGQIKRYGAQPVIKKRHRVSGIDNYELINPLPVSLDEGIKDVEAYTAPCEKKYYLAFLSDPMPDVIHIHTLMGLHREFLEAAIDLKIRTVFTSHDYFGLCPKVTLYRYGSCCDGDNFCKDCVRCNVNALSLKKIKIMQSPLYRLIKDTVLVKKLRKKHRETVFSNENIPELSNDENVEKEGLKYKKLRQYYIWMYENIEYIHFNSTVSESIYKRYIKPKNSGVISITHKGIKDNRDNPHSKSSVCRIVYLAPAKPFKGFNILKTALDRLWEEGIKNFELKVFSPVHNPSPYMVVCEGGFMQSELPFIFSEADILIAPSIWYETFGFTVLEALSYGVPVIVSNHVGAADEIKGSGVVFDVSDKNEPYKSLKEILTTGIDELRKRYNSHKVKEWSEFQNQMYCIYKENLNEKDANEI